MSSIPLIDPGDNAYFQMDWSDALGTGVTITSATHTVPSPLVRESQSYNDTTSTVRISGAVHGVLYMIEGAATLSTGEVLNRQFPVRGWNS